MHHKFSIYVITNTVNAKRYIGLTTISLNLRFNSHTAEARTENPRQLISRAIKKYGVKAFTIEHVLCCLTKEDMFAAEAAIILQEGTRDPSKGYNASAGGEGGSCGMPKSDAWKAAMSTQKMGNQHAKGAVRSTETRAKMGAWQIGRVTPQKTKDKIAATLRDSTENSARLEIARQKRKSHGNGITGLSSDQIDLIKSRLQNMPRYGAYTKLSKELMMSYWAIRSVALVLARSGT